jgi:hypothetical protein
MRHRPVRPLVGLACTHNPRWRLLDQPEGEVDWLRTALKRVTSGQPGYVSRASRTGLDPAEERALRGWMEWVSAHWAAYVKAVGVPEGAPQSLSWSSTDKDAGAGRPDLSRLRRWAHTAKRSRWPLLRTSSVYPVLIAA